MLTITYTPSANPDAFDFFFTNADASVPIGTLARADFFDGRFAFLQKIYTVLEVFGYEPDSSMHIRSMVKFFAALDEILDVGN